MLPETNQLLRICHNVVAILMMVMILGMMAILVVMIGTQSARVRIQGQPLAGGRMATYNTLLPAHLHQLLQFKLLAHHFDSLLLADGRHLGALRPSSSPETVDRGSPDPLGKSCALHALPQLILAQRTYQTLPQPFI